MRNLKKILALALALVMSMSLMATANAFSDDEDITGTYKTAVDVLSGLEVFQGYEDGSFDPKGAITRAEVAAILYRIVTGDVDDTQKDIYADYGLFDDVASTSWYAGYVNFCANAEYIKGYDADTFGPNDPVTGYQALAMILRALGYDKNDEFTGTDWHIQTAAVGEQRKITKNITAGTLQSPATREVVAEILFRAILVETVNYTPAFGYQIGDTSLGEKTFGLKDITGVVVANEYADLYSGTPLKTGKTELVEDGESYVVNHATTVEDLGEARHAYVTGETVLAIADADNTVWTNDGAETDIGSDKDFEDVTTLVRDDETEEYINFGGDGDVYESDFRIEFELTFANWTVKSDFADEYGIAAGSLGNQLTYENVIRAGDAITENDLAIIKGIFAAADDDDVTEGIQGSVYVGTRSNANAEDVSDDMSYRAFYNEYITEVGDSAEVNGADNGEWLKVVDNDGDGVADYVFRVDFAMSVIERISRDDEYTLADLDNHDEVSFTDVEIDGSDIKTEDELAEGDVVIYTLIDGNYYMSIAEMVTETVDKKGINSKTETMTCDGTDYIQSHIGYTDDTDYYYDVTDAHTEVTYDLYLDHFNYVRLFIESDYNTFMLLTDGYFETNYRDEAFKAYYWNVDDAEEQEIDLVDNAWVDTFINTDDVNNDGNRQTWRRLNDAGDVYDFDPANGNEYVTNIAGYSESEDGYALVPADESTRRADYDVQEIRVTNDTELDARILNNYAGDRIQATTNTQYYLVVKASDRFDNEYVDYVLTWTGYANTPDEAALADDAVAYAVTHDGSSALYDVADVVVFETDPTTDRDTYFVYTYNNWDDADDERIEFVWALGYGEDGKIVDDQVDVERDADDIYRYGVVEFYEITENGNVTYIGADYADYNIYAGWVSVNYEISGDDYIQVDDTAAGILEFNPENIAIYRVTGDADSDNGEYGVSVVENWDDIEVGNRMILFTDSDENVEYAIIVEMSAYEDANGDDKVYTVVSDLWQAIWDDAKVVTYLTAAPKSVVLTLGGDASKTLLEGANNTITYAQWEALADNENVPVTVTPADGNQVAISGQTTFVSTKIETSMDLSYGEGTITVLSQGDRKGEVTETYTYTVKVEDANTEAELVAANNQGVVIENMGEKFFGVKGNGTVNVAQLMDMFKASKSAPLAEVKWSFMGNNGVTYNEDSVNGSWDVNTFSEIVATVIPQQGLVANYTFADVALLTVNIDGVEESSEYVVSGYEYTPEASSVNAGAREITEDTVINYWTITLTSSSNRTVNPDKVVVEETSEELVLKDVKVTRSDGNFGSTAYKGATSSDNAAVATQNVTAADNVATMEVVFTNVTESGSATIALGDSVTP